MEMMFIPCTCQCGYTVGSMVAVGGSVYIESGFALHTAISAVCPICGSRFDWRQPKKSWVELVANHLRRSNTVAV